MPIMDFSARRQSTTERKSKNSDATLTRQESIPRHPITKPAQTDTKVRTPPSAARHPADLLGSIRTKYRPTTPDILPTFPGRPTLIDRATRERNINTNIERKPVAIKKPAVPRDDTIGLNATVQTINRPGEVPPKNNLTTRAAIIAEPPDLLSTIEGLLDSLSLDPSTVRFSRLRVPIWKGTAEQLERTIAEGGISDREVPTGLYLFTMNVTEQNRGTSWAISKSFPFTASGKKMIFHKGKYDAITGLMQVQIEVVENLIPLLIVITAGMAATGFAGYGVASSLTQVDKVMSNSWKIALAAGAGFLGYVLLIRKKKAS